MPYFCPVLSRLSSANELRDGFDVESDQSLDAPDFLPSGSLRAEEFSAVKDYFFVWGFTTNRRMDKAPASHDCGPAGENGSPTAVEAQGEPGRSVRTLPLGAHVGQVTGACGLLDYAAARPALNQAALLDAVPDGGADDDVQHVHGYGKADGAADSRPKHHAAHFDLKRSQVHRSSPRKSNLDATDLRLVKKGLTVVDGAGFRYLVARTLRGQCLGQRLNAFGVPAVVPIPLFCDRVQVVT